MKQGQLISIATACLLGVCRLGYGQEKGPTVQPFLPEIMAQFPNVRDLTINSGEDEVYFTAQSYMGDLSAIITCSKQKGKWSKPEVASFSGQYQDLEPFLSADELRLYFVSNRPKNDQSNAKDYDIWFVERKKVGANWSEPKNLGAPVNTKEDEFYPSLSNTGNLCFTRDGAGSKGKDDIFYSKWQNGAYTIPVSMSDSINTDGYEFNAFLAPDESFLMYTCYNRGDGFGSGDLYISFNKGNGIWSRAENLGAKINDSTMDYCPFVDLKSGILYFTSKRNAIQKQTGKRRNAADLLKEMNQYENGLSRVYRVDVRSVIQQKQRKE
jgi:hypothetical protein